MRTNCCLTLIRVFVILFLYTPVFCQTPALTYITGAMRIILTSILPFGIMASYPATIFLEGFDWMIVLQFFGVVLAFGVGMKWFWNKGIAVYSSASS